MPNCGPSTKFWLVSHSATLFILRNFSSSGIVAAKHSARYILDIVIHAESAVLYDYGWVLAGVRRPRKVSHALAVCIVISFVWMASGMSLLQNQVALFNVKNAIECKFILSMPDTPTSDNV